MPGSTSILALPYPLPTEAPDGAGGIQNLAAALDAILGGNTFGAGVGNGATIGANAGSDGRFLSIGKHLFARGRIVFGSSASWGSPGSATLTGLPLASAMNQGWSNGYGRFIPSGGTPIPVQFQPHPNGTDMYIAPVISGSSGSPATLGSAYQLGSIPQSSILTFALDIVMT